MAMSVRERIREVGILKTLGYPNAAILFIVLGEAAVISLLGGIVGLVLAKGLISVVVEGSGGFVLPQAAAMTPLFALLLLGFAAAVGLASALIPAANAARTNILDAIRSTA